VYRKANEAVRAQARMQRSSVRNPAPRVAVKKENRHFRAAAAMLWTAKSLKTMGCDVAHRAFVLSIATVCAYGKASNLPTSHHLQELCYAAGYNHDHR